MGPTAQEAQGGLALKVRFSNEWWEERPAKQLMRDHNDVLHQGFWQELLEACKNKEGLEIQYSYQ